MSTAEAIFYAQESCQRFDLKLHSGERAMLGMTGLLRDDKLHRVGCAKLRLRLQVM